MTESAPQAPNPDEYAHLLDPSFDASHMTIEGAARQPEATVPVSSEVQSEYATVIESAARREEEPSAFPPAQTSNRAGYWTRPTADQVDNAAKHGFDLTKQDKYH